MGRGNLLIVKKELNHLDETKLDKYESILFLQCLKDEKERHEQAKKYALWTAYLHHDNNVIKKFYTLQAVNHVKDLEMIEYTIVYLINKWGIE